jgi:Antibiotic biosynthesis monooxygenase
MIFIVVKFETKPEWTARWPDLVAPFTAATRAVEGNFWFEWSRGLDNPAEYVLVEAFRGGRRRRRTRQQRSLQGRAARPAAGAGAHSEGDLSDHRRHWLVEAGRDQRGLSVYGRTAISSPSR